MNRYRKSSPETDYLFSSAEGDIPVSKSDLAKPLILDMDRRHDAISFGDYMALLAAMIQKDDCRIIREISQQDRPVDRIIIKSEKLGAFYNIASISAFSGTDLLTRLAASAACTQRGKRCLENDFMTMRQFAGSHGSRYIPSFYHMEKDMPVPGKDGHTFSITLSEWFEGYSEWHFTRNGTGEGKAITVWDTQKGAFFLNEREEHELFRKMSFIHTLYYDCGTGRHICMWHHSAGDFIIRCTGKDVSVKLTTIRKYGNCIPFIDTAQGDRLAALIYFFLDLTVRMRLDRLDGTGEPVIAGKKFLSPVITGFLDALGIMEKKGLAPPPIPAEQFATLMAGMDRKELATLFQPLEAFYRHREDETNMPFLSCGFQAHIDDLHDTLGAYRTDKNTGTCNMPA